MTDVKMFCQTLLILAFLAIFIQDLKDKMVYWFLYPLVGLLAFFIQYQMIGLDVVVVNVLLNLLFVMAILSCAYLYAYIKLQKAKLTEVLGLGDILLFVFLAFTFSTVSFFVIFVFSLLFALAMHLMLKKEKNDIMVPLAGYMSFFFSIVYVYDLFWDVKILYTF